MTDTHRIDVEGRIDVIRLIGTLDRCISEMLVMANEIDEYDEPDRQTLKHHAEDAIAAGQKVLKTLGVDTAVPKFSLPDDTPCVCGHPLRAHDDPHGCLAHSERSHEACVCDGFRPKGPYR